MKIKTPKILALTTLLALTVLTLSIIALTAAGNALASAPSANNTHMAVYTAAPGEVIKGQVTVMNPTKEVKVINAHVQNPDNAEVSNQVLELLNTNLPVCSTMNGGWIHIPDPSFRLSANQKAVVRYEIGVPKDVTDGCYEAIHLQENYPSSKLSLLHTIIIQVGGENLLRPAGPYDTGFYKTSAAIAIISLALGVALAIKVGKNFLIQKQKRRKKR